MIFYFKYTLLSGGLDCTFSFWILKLKITVGINGNHRLKVVASDL